MRRGFYLCFCLSLGCLSMLSWAAGKGTLSYRSAVFQRPNEESKVLFYLEAGQRVDILGSAGPDDEYFKVRVERGKKLRVGYIPQIAMESGQNEVVKVSDAPATVWYWGGGAQVSHITQKSRTFETDDEVNHATTDYTSRSASPFLSIQYRDRDFWRLTLAYKTIQYKATAISDVGTSADKDVSLKYDMISLMLARVYMPFSTPVFYIGGGVGMERAISVQLKLGGQTLPTTGEDKPTYYLAELITGGRFKLGQRNQLHLEVRGGVAANQSPLVYQVEAAIGFSREI